MVSAIDVSAQNQASTATTERGTPSPSPMRVALAERQAMSAQLSSRLDERRDIPPPRVGWPDVAVIALVLGFAFAIALFLHVPVQQSVLTATGTVGAMVVVIDAPRRIAQILRLLHEVKARLGSEDGP